MLIKHPILIEAISQPVIHRHISLTDMHHSTRLLDSLTYSSSIE